MVTHIESYNLKDAFSGITASQPADGTYYDGEAVDTQSPGRHYRLIGDLQQELDKDNVINLKRVIRVRVARSGV